MCTFKRKYNIQDEMSLFQDAEWVKNVIKSCETISQYFAVNKLVCLLQVKYENKVSEFIMHLVMSDVNHIWDCQLSKLQSVAHHNHENDC